MAQTVKEVMTKNPVACDASDTAKPGDLAMERDSGSVLADISAAPGNR